MPAINVIDRIYINAPAELVYQTVADYRNITRWFPLAQCTLINASRLEEGVKVKHVYGYPPLMKVSTFTRQIDRMVPNQWIEESYIEGDLRGTGVWNFTEQDGKTLAAFHCDVSAKTFITKMAFMSAGSLSHRMAYKQLLKALKVFCEQKVKDLQREEKKKNWKSSVKIEAHNGGQTALNQQATLQALTPARTLTKPANLGSLQVA